MLTINFVFPDENNISIEDLDMSLNDFETLLKAAMQSNDLLVIPNGSSTYYIRAFDIQSIEVIDEPIADDTDDAV